MNSHDKLVSIIVNCYNSELYINDALDSALSQTYENFEIIVWDNLSTDNTKEIVNSFKSDKIKYFLSTEHTSLGMARNNAIRHSSGSYIAFLDSDDIWLPTKLEKQIPEFEDDSIGLVISDTFFFKANKNVRQLYKRKKPPTGYVFKELLTHYFISLETAVVRREALFGLDYYFDERFEVIEEYDLFVRISYNWNLAYVDDVLAKWRIHSNSWTWKKSFLFAKEKKLALKSYLSLFPDFDTHYSQQIIMMQHSIAIAEMWYLLSRNDRNKARRILIPFLFPKSYNLRIHLLYFLLLLPFNTFPILKKIRYGIWSE